MTNVFSTWVNYPPSNLNLLTVGYGMINRPNLALGSSENSINKDFFYAAHRRHRIFQFDMIVAPMKKKWLPFFFFFFTCHMLPVTCHLSLQQIATAIDPPHAFSPPLRTLGWFAITQKHKKNSSLSILALVSLTKSLQSTKKQISRRGPQTDIATYRLNRPWSRNCWFSKKIQEKFSSLNS